MTYQQALDDWRELEAHGHSGETALCYDGYDSQTKQPHYMLAVLRPRLRLCQSAEEAKRVLSGDFA